MQILAQKFHTEKSLRASPIPHHTNTSRSGVTLIVVMLITLTCMVAVSSVIYVAGNYALQSWKQAQMEQAFFLAEAGIEHAAAYALSGTGGRIDSTVLSGDLGKGRFETVVEASDIGWDGQSIEVFSTGYVHGVSYGIRVSGMRNMSWAQFALWYDREALTLNIAPGDVFWGQVYSKPQMRFSSTGIKTYGPAIFYDRVWTVPKTISVEKGADPTFHKGIIMGAEPQSMASVDMATLKQAAQTSAGGLIIEGDATIELRGNQMLITSEKNGWDKHPVPIPPNGIVYAQAAKYSKKVTTTDRWGRTTTTTKSFTEYGDLFVSGQAGFSGNITLVSERDVSIIDHVKYARDPMVYPDSTDGLGLIANRNVMVDTTAPNNLEVYAHIICRDGGFGVKNYNSGKQRGSLKVFGGIANLIRNAVGTSSSSGGTGYLKNYIFDTRLVRNPPPFYPRLQDRMRWSSWEG